MKVNFVDIFISNLSRKEIKIKLPKKNKDLQKILIKREITDSENARVEDFDLPFKSVTNIELKNFKIQEPTNIYYLNSYLEILKEKDLDLPEEEVEINTQKLKEIIADLIGSDNKNMNLEEIYEFINEEQKKKENEGMNERTKEKPIFSIKELQRKALERKGIKLER